MGVKTSVIRKLDTDIWEAWQDFKFMGLSFGARMTVIRLRDGGLWLHSPIRLTPAVREGLEELGPIRFVVAPNLFHHLFVLNYAALASSARFLITPGLGTKRKDLAFAERIDVRSLPEEWQGLIEARLVGGMPKVRENVFFHVPSRTLIVTDLFFNLAKVHSRGLKSLWPRVALTLNRINGVFGISRVFQSQIEDRRAFDQSMREILSWDFERIVMAHGRVIERDGKIEFLAALQRR